MNKLFFLFAGIFFILSVGAFFVYLQERKLFYMNLAEEYRLETLTWLLLSVVCMFTGLNYN